MRIASGLFFIILSLLSVFRMYALSSYEEAKDLYQSTDFNNNPSAVYSVRLAESVKEAADLYLSANSAKKLKASYLIDLARKMSSENDRISAYCSAFNELSRLIQKEPHDAKLLINWADLQQITENTGCKVNLSRDLKKEIINYALKNDPANTEILYSAGLLYSWSSFPEQSISAFHDMIKLSSKIPEGRKEIILDMVDSAETFSKLVPARFPQITEWTKLLKEKKPEIYFKSANEVENLQLEALEQSMYEMHDGRIPATIQLNNLQGLLSITATDKVRKTVLQHISGILGAGSKLGIYLNEISSLNPVKVVRAEKIYDTQPHKGAFSDWDKDKKIILDANSQSVGFYKNRNDIVRYIELASEKPAQKINPGELRFFISNDNQVWKEVFLNFRQISNPNLEKHYLVIEATDSDFKYFKVNFRSDFKRSGFYNKASDILHVYG